jgi:23S rRNA pseudouridine1911/1915/1917 synthase
MNKFNSCAVIDETNEFLVLSKNSGVHTILLKPDDLNTVSCWIVSNVTTFKVLPEQYDNGLVNRLDYWTTGILLVAKTTDIWYRMRNIYRKNLVKKKYLAIVEGRSPTEITINLWIGAKYRGSKKVHCFTEKPPNKYRALPACSYLTRLSYNNLKQISNVLITTSTGRRHQVRAHCAAIGNPLIGDILYGAKRSTNEDRFYLHAEEVSFIWNNSELTFRAPNTFPDNLFSEC